MKDNQNGSIELSEALFLGGIALVLGLLIFTIQRFSVFVLEPSLKFLTDYFKHYARGTGEVVGLGIIALAGARAHLIVTKRLAETFESANQQLNQKIEKLESVVRWSETKNTELTARLGQESDKLRFTKQNLLARDEELASHRIEIERLKNPEAFARKLKDAEQKNGKLQLLGNLKTLNVQAER